MLPRPLPTMNPILSVTNGGGCGGLGVRGGERRGGSGGRGRGEVRGEE